MDKIVASLKREKQIHKELAAATNEADRDRLMAELNAETKARAPFYAQFAGSQGDADALRKMEDHMNEAKQSFTDSRRETLKMLDIQSYYGKQYEGYAAIARALAVIAAIVLLTRFLPDWTLPYSNWLKSITLWVGGFYVIYLAWDASNRRNDKYDEYKWGWVPRKLADLDAANMGGQLGIKGFNLGVCAGSYCCGDGTVWNADNAVCDVSK